jgi:hypothetical protein
MKESLLSGVVSGGDHSDDCTWVPRTAQEQEKAKEEMSEEDLAMEKRAMIMSLLTLLLSIPALLGA